MGAPFSNANKIIIEPIIRIGKISETVSKIKSVDKSRANKRLITL